MGESPRENESPWRALFETVREAVGTQRDASGVRGSINWLRRQMEARGANPNVVRNIIYRDKGKVVDKRALLEILRELWATARDEPLHAPEIEVLLSPHASAEQEVLQLLGREKRRAFRAFVRGVREGEHPKLLVTGRSGSGKTMLSDYIQHALQVPPTPPVEIVRAEFGSRELGTTLGQLGERLGVDREALDARLTKIASAGAYAVQADAQAELARSLVEAVRLADPPCVLLLHVSQSLALQQTLGAVPLRLNTPDVPRVSASEWLWASLLEPLSRLDRTSVLASMTELPSRALHNPSGFAAPVKLTPPTAGEARRFVKARLPHLPAAQQEEIVQRAERSFEELRTLTLLAEIREPLPEDSGSTAPVARLSDLVVTPGASRLRDFLAALATVSLPAYPTFRARDLAALRPEEQREPNELEVAFLDPVPGGEDDELRCFSRRLVRALRERLAEGDPERYARLHAEAAAQLADEAEREPRRERAGRYVHHLFEARSWNELIAWMRRYGAPPSLVQRIWNAAAVELRSDERDAFERLAEQVAAHFVKLGAFGHPDALSAFEVLGRSSVARRRAWSIVKRAEGAVLRGRFEEASDLLAADLNGADPLTAAEEALVHASIARWRGELETAVDIVERDARPRLAPLDSDDPAVCAVRAKAAVWAGLIHKDRGDLQAAAAEFAGVEAEDDLVRARLSFQAGDVAMSLGRFGEARRTFDDAVERAHRSGALGSERALYLARRGALRFRTGDVAAAEADHSAALTVLDEQEVDGLEWGFWRARVDVERAETLLATGRHDAAIATLATAVDRFRAYGEARGVDAEYRIDRAVLSLATAYLARATGVPWRAPLPLRSCDLPRSDDVEHALELLARVAERVPEGTEEAQVPDALARQALLLTALFSDREAGANALARAERLTRCRHDEAETAACRAAFALRVSDVEAARRATEHGWTVLTEIDDPLGDPGLRGRLIALEAETAVARGDERAFDAALQRLATEASPPCLREPILRAIGTALERHERQAWLDRPDAPEILGRGAAGADLLRLGDRLAARASSDAVERSGAHPYEGTRPGLCPGDGSSADGRERRDATPDALPVPADPPA